MGKLVEMFFNIYILTCLEDNVGKHGDFEEIAIKLPQLKSCFVSEPDQLSWIFFFH